jgi:tRNA(Ile)-lysidine synthase
VALAVSGGSDSVALMHLAKRWVDQRNVRPRLTVLTVDHGLRLDSAGEAQRVQGWAEGLGLAHHTLSWTGPRPARGIQAKARAARYDLMSGWCKAHGAEAILTAHTTDDQIETVLMRMARTDSVDSLAGIPPRGEWNGIAILRPLLGWKREDLRRELAAWRQEWIDDPSNDDPRFERVRVRAALKQLAEAGFDTMKLAGLAARCREVADLTDAAARHFMSAHMTVHGRGYGTIDSAAFASLPLAVRLSVLRAVLAQFGGGKQPLLAELKRLAIDLDGKIMRRTLAGAVVWRRNGDILVAREPGRIAADPAVLPASGQLIWDGRFTVTAPPGFRVVPGRLVAGRPRAAGVPRPIHDAEPAVLGPDGQPVEVNFDGRGEVRATFRDLKKS